MNTIAWAAGLFEGEGCFYVTKPKRRNGYGFYEYPSASLKMTDEDVVRRFHKIVGFGSVSFVSRKNKNKKWKDAWNWYCYGFEYTGKLFKMFAPFLGIRRLATGKKILSITKTPRILRGHGTEGCYQRGCKCRQCKRAHSDKAVSWRATRSRSTGAALKAVGVRGLYSPLRWKPLAQPGRAQALGAFGRGFKSRMVEVGISSTHRQQYPTETAPRLGRTTCGI